MAILERYAFAMRKYWWTLGLCFVFLIFLGFPTYIQAQQQGSQEDVNISIFSSFSAFHNAVGMIGWMIIALSIVALALIIENFVSLQYKKLIPPDLLDDVEKLFEEEAYEDALEACTAESCYFTNVIASALDHIEGGYDEMVKSSNNMLEEETVKIQQKISWIQLIATIAPMLGLLGTVWGMIMAFQKIAGMTVVQPKYLAAGIYQALTTTYLGLIVSISCVVCYFYLRNKIVRITMELSNITTDLLARFKK